MTVATPWPGDKPTVAQAINHWCAEFGTAGLVFGHGTDSAWDEAVALVLHVCNLPDEQLSLQRPLTRQHVERLKTLALRRINERIPLPYLLGYSQLAGYRFHITPGVVVPRSPLAHLLVADAMPRSRTPLHILDLCTGSGCLAIIAAHTFAAARVCAVDIDPSAVELARRNVAEHSLDARVTVLQGDLYTALDRDARFDLILANPPYVLADDMASLPPEYRHEPALGLAGGTNGITLVQRIVAGAHARMQPGGALVCEVGRSASQLARCYPNLALTWLDLPDGGEGVFCLGAEELAVL